MPFEVCLGSPLSSLACSSHVDFKLSEIFLFTSRRCPHDRPGERRGQREPQLSRCVRVLRMTLRHVQHLGVLSLLNSLHVEGKLPVCSQFLVRSVANVERSASATY